MFVVNIKKHVKLTKKKKKSKELLEALFSCWGYLFKYLHRQLIRELSSLFIRFEPLFSHKREYVRQFAAQSFAFLVRYGFIQFLLFFFGIIILLF